MLIGGVHGLPITYTLNGPNLLCDIPHALDVLWLDWDVYRKPYIRKAMHSALNIPNAFIIIIIVFTLLYCIYITLNSPCKINSLACAEH